MALLLFYHVNRLHVVIGSSSLFSIFNNGIDTSNRQHWHQSGIVV